MGATFNIKSIREKILTNNKTKSAVISLAEDRVLQKKNDFINSFENHPVTQEINGGPNSSNISRTLGGYGNLFSFIGFESSSSPVGNVLDLIKKINILKNSLKINASKNIYSINVRTPGLENFGNITKMPWESGRSWLLDIEKTISGVGAYLYGKFSTSRSGSGIQSKYNYSNVSFKSVKYFQTLYNNFLKSLNRR
jgi:hypothetical protein